MTRTVCAQLGYNNIFGNNTINYSAYELKQSAFF